MTLTTEDLQAISKILDAKFEEKLQPVIAEISELKTDMAQVKTEINELKSDVSELKSDMIQVKAEINELKSDMAQVKTEISELKADVSELKTDMIQVKSEISELKADVGELKSDMIQVKSDIEHINNNSAEFRIHLENVTDRGIKIIGEGHADLTRKLDEALRIENEKEILLLRMNYLEGELQMVKRRLSELEKTA